MTAPISGAPIDSTREGPKRSRITSPMISSGVSTCCATVTPRPWSRTRRSVPVERELFETNASARPCWWSAWSISFAPGLSTSPFQMQPSRSKTNPRSAARLGAATILGLRPGEVGDRVGVDLARALGNPAPAELRLDALASGAPHRAAAGPILEQRADGRGQRVRPRRLHQHAGLAILDHLDDAADGRGDDRRLARHRFQIDQTERLVARWAH